MKIQYSSWKEMHNLLNVETKRRRTLSWC